jgi:hypothetical protein
VSQNESSLLLSWFSQVFGHNDEKKSTGQTHDKCSVNVKEKIFPESRRY